MDRSSDVLRCDMCGAPALAVAPGTEPVRELFVLDAGAPRRQWCERCWPMTGRRHAWSSEMLDALRRMYGRGADDEAIAAALGVSKRAVISKRHQFGLVRSVHVGQPDHKGKRGAA